MKTISKKKLGRPKAIEDFEMHFAGQWSSAKTIRGMQNWCYMLRAMKELGITERENKHSYKFCASTEDIDSGKSELPMALLSEIGRLHPDDMRLVATEIDKRGLSVRDAIKFVKQCRIGTTKRKYSQFKLYDKLSDVINKYREKHESTTDQLTIAIRSLLEIVSEKEWVVDE